MASPVWDAFDVLGRVPLMVLRGESSDLFSEATLAATRARPSIYVVMVLCRGRAPVLDGIEMLQRLAVCMTSCERLGPGWR